MTKAQALKHPNWSMGAKITIDSASLMNKGLEVIEAKWLFGVKGDKIKVVVHPQSIIHSMVEFEDGSIKSQMVDYSKLVPVLIKAIQEQQCTVCSQASTINTLKTCLGIN